jgi:signal transduction histidine kinase
VLAAAALLVAAALVVVLAVTHRRDDFVWAVDGPGFLLNPVGVGVVCGLAGAVGWAVHRQSSVGALLTAAGLLWLAQLAPLAEGDLAVTIGALTLGAYTAPLVHVALAFPDGVRPYRLDHALLFAVYGFALVHGLVNAIFSPSIDDRSSLLLVGAGSEAVIEQAGLLYLVPVAAQLCVLVLMVRRWWRATPVTRRSTGLVVLAAALTLVYLVASTLFLQGGKTVSAVVLMAVPVALVAALVRSRTRRVAIDDLMVGLGDQAGADLDALQVVLGRALRDPSLVLLRGDRSAEVDLAQAARRWPRQEVLPLVRRGRTVGALVHDPGVKDEHRRLAAVAAAAALVLDNGLLVNDLAEQLREVSTSRARIVTAGDVQRRRLERDLHDGAQQRLVSAALMLQVARADLADQERGAPGEDARSLISDALAELSSALEELRELAHGLAPATLSEYGLAVALETLLGRFPIPITLRCSLPERLDPAVERAAYYLVAEALTNTVKHAAASAISVDVAIRGWQLCIAVRDDGVGGADPSGFGVLGMSDRAAALGGTFRLVSEPGHGTEITATIPARTA